MRHIENLPGYQVMAEQNGYRITREIDGVSIFLSGADAIKFCDEFTDHEKNNTMAPMVWRMLVDEIVGCYFDKKERGI